ncbi:glycogen debranching enzyme [Melghirimyces profundicolus]|uniref:Glycogen debranching enzyme n=1 Tax=Melghirimyces profundicolus TaxID=1242148 RepID=A0A2T6BST3_9BACL|nr:amylo-alpha-1,6-glucosidase [Melghirimyces profundicolus]PTX59151.1 glycogen debranching enzyme [Melghirimyces profundicolus]
MSHVIKEGDLFLFTDEDGNIPEGNREKYGLYMKDTRFLSLLEWSMGDLSIRPLSAEAEGAESLYRCTHGEGKDLDGRVISRESLEMTRNRWIYKGVLYETFTLINRGRTMVHVPLTFRFDADFSDMFVVRGYKEAELGDPRIRRETEKGVRFTYWGTDGIERATAIQFLPAPDRVEGGQATLSFYLEPGASKRIHLTCMPSVGGEIREVFEESVAREAIREAYGEWFDSCPTVESDSSVFNSLYRRSLSDFRMLMTDMGEGEIPVAGLPWFAVPFGRDSIIASLQALSVHPETAKNTARTLARFQGKEVNPYRDEEPGKILHEIRFGELAETGAIPHTPYYGTIDATPLFLVLVAEIHRWTGDDGFVREMLPHVRKALEWIDTFGDPGGYGYTAYEPRSEQALFNQGWKDSDDSNTHTDGTLAPPPIALSEVQGYVYMAKKAWSDLFHQIGNIEDSRRLAQEADRLREKFHRDFWMEEEDFPAIALDQEKKQVANVSSNPGHCLMAEMFDPEQADRVVKRLMEKDMFNGWGIRTLSSQAPSYNPFSYHNGSVWPHDNSLILFGMKKMGCHREAERLIGGLLEAAAAFPDTRLPELFCGYGKEEGRLVPYPVACSPQAWAAGTAFAVLQAILGLEPEASRKQIRLSPRLPEGMERLEVRGIRAGKGTLDISLLRREGETFTRIHQNTTGWLVTVLP